MAVHGVTGWKFVCTFHYWIGLFKNKNEHTFRERSKSEFELLIEKIISLFEKEYKSYK